jgi:hypothetical protein
MRLPPAARPADVTFWIHRSPLKDLRTAGAIRNLCLQQSPDYPAHIAWSVPERSPVVMAGDLRTVLNAVQSTSTSAAGVPDAIMTTFQVGGEPLGRHIIRLGHPDRGPWATLSDANTWHWPGWGIGGYLGVPIPSALHQEVLDLLTARVLATRGAEQRYAAAILLSHARTGVDLGAERRLLEERFPGLVATAEAMARRFNAPLSPSRMTSGDRILLRQGLDRLPGRSTPTAVAEPGTWTVRWMESDYRMHVVIRIQTEADPAQPLRRKATVELHEPKRSLATYPAWAFRDANGVIHVDARGQKVSGRANWRPESYAIHADGAVGYLDNSGSGGWGLRVEALPATTPPEPTPAPAAPPRTEGF